MDGFDRSVIAWLNGFAHRSEAFDGAVRLLAWNDLLKGGAVVPLLWWAWFAPRRDPPRAREIVLSTMLGCLVSITFARLLAHVLPYRVRPVFDPTLRFTAPYGPPPDFLGGWSAIPSDHAVLFFTLATGILCVDRRLGALALLHALLVIGLPRLYLGLHWPSDILVGAVLGVGFGWLATRPGVRRRVAGPLLRWGERRAGLLYAGLFLLSFQIVTLFDSLRSLGGFALELLGGLQRRLP